MPTRIHIGSSLVATPTRDGPTLRLRGRVPVVRATRNSGGPGGRNTNARHCSRQGDRNGPSPSLCGARGRRGPVRQGRCRAGNGPTPCIRVRPNFIYYRFHAVRVLCQITSDDERNLTTLYSNLRSTIRLNLFGIAESEVKTARIFKISSGDLNTYILKSCEAHE